MSEKEGTPRGSRGFVVAFGTACLLGIAVGFLDLQFSEVQSSVLVLLVFTFVMGAVSPRFAWLWALLIGGGVFGAHAFARAANIPILAPPNHLVETLIALVPAFVGAYSGVGARALLTAGSSRL